VNSAKWLRFAKFGFIGAVALIALIFIAIPVFSYTLPPPDQIVRREGFSTKILDRNGELLYDIFADERRTPVDIDEVPDYLRQATIAIEDKNFYKHGGFDLTAYPRALFNILVKQKLQGGSTLTQQLVKNVLLTSERTIVRKVKEFVLAVQIESRFSKDEILQMYLNEAPYGGTAWGVQSAAETYFGKGVGELTLTESAFLAGLPQRPSVYSPYSSSPKSYIDRTKGVLRRMREDDYITREQEEASVAELDGLEFQARGANFKAPHFVQYVQAILEERYGERLVQQGGLKVVTSLDLELQEAAQEIVTSEIAKVEGLDIGNGAAIVIDPSTGEILAMVGSKDFGADDYDGQVNVTLSLRQPGSAIKPIVYATGLAKGYTASTLFVDAPTTFPGGIDLPEYEPVNYDGEYRGPIQLRYAIGNSINVVAVKMVALVGVEEVLENAYNMGLTSLEPTQATLNRVGLSLALGGGEVRLIDLTGAFGIFMNGGKRVELVSILSVTDNDGKILEEAEFDDGKQVIEPAHAYIMADILSDNGARTEVFGSNSLLNIAGRRIAVKTGTTNDKRDNWAVGGDSQVVVGVWVGNNDNSPMKQVASGVSGATPIWRKIVLEALSGKPNLGFERPSDVVTASVDLISGYRAHDGLPERTEVFASGTEPGEDLVHVLLKVCKGRDGLASPSQVAGQDFEEKAFLILEEEDPTAAAGQENLWQKGILEWIEAQEEEIYRPPTEYCGGGSVSPINVEFIEPRDRNSDLSGDFKVRFTAETIHGLEEMRLEVDGVVVRTFTGPPFEYEVSLEDGVHEFRAIALDREGNESDRRITVGIGVAWDYSPTPAPTP